MKSFGGKVSLMAVLISGLAGAHSALAEEIKIGVVLPLSGALSGYGQPSQKGLDLIQSITPTLKNGDTIKLIVIDDKSDKVEAANAMQRLVSSDKVDAVIGEVTSSNTLAMVKIATTPKRRWFLRRQRTIVLPATIRMSAASASRTASRAWSARTWHPAI